MRLSDVLRKLGTPNLSFRRKEESGVRRRESPGLSQAIITGFLLRRNDKVPFSKILKSLNARFNKKSLHIAFCTRLLFLPAMACLCFGFTGETVVGNQTEQGNSVKIGFFTESLSIEGDFDGNGKKEALSEKCMDCKSYQEREAEGTLNNKNSRAELLLACSDRIIPQLTVVKHNFLLGLLF
jgi:hypothetical protein